MLGPVCSVAIPTDGGEVKLMNFTETVSIPQEKIFKLSRDSIRQ